METGIRILFVKKKMRMGGTRERTKAKSEGSSRPKKVSKMGRVDLANKTMEGITWS